MNKKKYVAPCAELTLLIPAETVATDGSWSWKWQWGKSALSETASVAGTKTFWDAALDSTSSDDTY